MAKKTILLLVLILAMSFSAFAQNKLTMVVADSCGFKAAGNGASLTAIALSNGSAAITQVQFFADGTALGAPLTTAPYVLVFDTTKLTNGCHIVTATATDTDGNTGTAQISVSIKN
jgi:hypothetical protein